MIITLEARTRCTLCSCWLALIACPSMRVNKRSLRQLPGLYLTARPGSCPECGTREHGEMYRATVWRLTAESCRDVDDYRARRWP
jgi:hypothetical protein